MLEMIGYLGSALVVVSMLMSLVIKLRMINTIGSGIFAAYALMIHSYPTALTNGFLIGINVYNLIKQTQKDRSYDLVEGAQGEGLLRYLLDYSTPTYRDCSIGAYLYSKLPSKGGILWPSRERKPRPTRYI